MKLIASSSGGSDREGEVILEEEKNNNKTWTAILNSGLRNKINRNIASTY